MKKLKFRKLLQDLLSLLYKNNGPVSMVYKKHGIEYEYKDFLKIIGNELYSDKEEELHTLFPAQSFMASKNLKPVLKGFSGLTQTNKNIKNFSKISADNYSDHFNALRNKIESKDEPVQSLKNYIEEFLKDYEIIFEINLMAGISLSKLKTLAEKRKLSLAAILSQGVSLIQEDLGLDFELETQNLKGNSLDVADESEFIENISIKSGDNNLARKFSEKEKKIIKEAVIFSHLRELGRQFIVVKINSFRKLLFEIAKKNNFKDTRNIYFAKLDEAIKGKAEENKCKQRKIEHEKYNNFTLPKILTSKLEFKDEDKPLGVSSGAAAGILADINSLNSKNKDQILYVKVLSPDLVKHFSCIKGIVSEGGGMLSHLSIIARERKLPVVVNFNIHKEKVKIGDQVRIDGETGLVESASYVEMQE